METLRTIEFKVPDMSCGHCTATVASALEAVAGVDEAQVSLEKKIAKVFIEQGVVESTLYDAVREAGYTPEPVE